MSNLLKRANVISKNERVIDYNEVIKNKLEVLNKEIVENKIDTDGFVNGLDAEVVEALVQDTDEIENASIAGEEMAAASESAMQNGFESNVIKQADLEAVKAEAEDIIAKANEQACDIISEAKQEAEKIRNNAYTSGRDEGLADAQEEFDRRADNLEAELKEKEEQLKYEYESLKKQIEPELIEVLTDVFKKVTNTIAEDNQEMIFNLINSAMHNAEVSKEFVIKVSPEDYKFVVNNQGKIYCAMAKDVQIEIVEDLTMKKNQCIIESDSGIYDCSLDIQLENLIKDIKLLSCL